MWYVGLTATLHQKRVKVLFVCVEKYEYRYIKADRKLFTAFAFLINDIGARFMGGGGGKYLSVDTRRRDDKLKPGLYIIHQYAVKSTLIC